MNLPTDKIYVIVLRDGTRIWINKDQFEKIKKLANLKIPFIEVEDHFISVHSITHISLASDIEKLDKFKKGDYFCEAHNQWIPRGKTCGFC